MNHDELINAIADMRDSTGIFERNNLTISCPIECVLEAKAYILQLKAALKFYAQEHNWSKPYMRQGRLIRNAKIIMSVDGGALAREVLK